MSPRSDIEIEYREYQGEWIHFRRGYFILQVYSQGDDENAVSPVIDKVLDGIDFSIVGDLHGRWASIRLNEDRDLVALLDSLNLDSDVEFAEPDMIMTTSVLPHDPYLEAGSDYHQWGIAYMNLPAVWDIETGTTDVLIGLIDSGVVMTGSRELPLQLHHMVGSAMLHEDLDGDRFVVGNNFRWGDPVAWPGDEHPLNHGTHMAGIIAARQDNKNNSGRYAGIAGINWGSHVYLSVAFGSDEFTTLSLVRKSVEDVLNYAALENYTRVVINLATNYLDSEASAGWGTMTETFDLIRAAGAIICISAGNGSTSTGGYAVRHPARFALENPKYAPFTIVAGGVDKTDAFYEQTCHGKDDMVFGPAVNVGTTDTYDEIVQEHRYFLENGTSAAAAHATGLASLAWCRKTDYSAVEIVRCIKRSCRRPRSEFDAAKYGHGILDAKATFDRLRGHVELLTNAIFFIDTEPGLDHEQDIRFMVESCRVVTFTVAIPAGLPTFGISRGTYRHDPGAGEFFVLTATYGADDGDEERTTVTVTWDQHPEITWDIQISARRRGRRNAFCLVLDKSGSMDNASGLAGSSRMEVLKYSTDILVGLVAPGDGLGAVCFNQDADEVIGFREFGEGQNDPAREAVTAAIGDLHPGGKTSIAAGILLARELLDGVPADDNKAIILLTDGKQTHEPWLADLTPDQIGYPFFAIGMGDTATLQPDELTTLTDATDGYCVLSGRLEEMSENIIAEFLSQILAEMTAADVPNDPTFRLHPGSTQRFPVHLCEADKQIEVILMRRPGLPLACRVLDPAGREFDVGDLVTTESPRLLRHRIDATVLSRYPNPFGAWQVEVSSPADGFRDWLSSSRYDGREAHRLELMGVPCTFRVHARTNLRMRCRVSQSGFRPGAMLSLDVAVTHRSRPLRRQPEIIVHLTDPRGVTEQVPVAPRPGGHHAAQVGAPHAGTYVWHILAEGRVGAGHRFRREQRLTSSVWHAS